MKPLGVPVLAALLALAPSLRADDGARPESWWENPVYPDVPSSVKAAVEEAKRAGGEPEGPLGLFLRFNLTGKDLPGGAWKGEERQSVRNLLVTWPTDVARDDLFSPVLDRARRGIERDLDVVESRLARFGLPRPEGLVYLKFVPTIDSLNRGGVGRGVDEERVGGVTILCRYVVIPLSPFSLDEMRSPGLDRHRWAQEAVETAIRTFRHELVHVHANTAVGPPDYADREKFPQWFDEGIATYLGGDAHASLAGAYRDFQANVLYLVEKKGPSVFAAFVGDAVRERDATGALRRHYGLDGATALRGAAADWDHRSGRVGVLFFLGFLAAVILSFRLDRFPFLGGLSALLALLFLWWASSGTPEYLQGTNGPISVLVTKILFVLAAAFLSAGALASFRAPRRLAPVPPRPLNPYLGR